MRRDKPVLRIPTVSPGSRDFLWAAGIEDTFIAQPNPKTGRILDEYALTQHYERWREDIDLIRQLGVPAARYGIPWYRIERQRGRFDWRWTDEVLDTLVNTHGIEPIIDLMHYGTPAWLDGSFLAPSYPDAVAEYAAAFCERYRGLCYWFTPLNEPRINAWYAARLGWWPPYRRSWRDFAATMLALARGIVMTHRAIVAAEPQAVLAHVDATDLYLTSDPSLAAERDLRQEIVFLALDLVQGRVDESHPLREWLTMRGAVDRELEWFRDHAVRPHLIGYNMYPMFSEKHVLRGDDGALQIKIRRCGASTFERLTRMYAARYGIPVMCTETADRGHASRRIRWIEVSTSSVDAMRADGVPVVGYTYWPLFSLVSWPYASGTAPLDSYLVHMGLWDLQPDPERPGALDRVPTPAVEAYRARVSSPVAPLGAAVPTQTAPGQ